MQKRVPAHFPHCRQSNFGKNNTSQFVKERRPKARCQNEKFQKKILVFLRNYRTCSIAKKQSRRNHQNLRREKK